MAKKTVIELVDDLDGTQIDAGDGGTVTFALEGTTYEIDLTSAHLEELRGALALYIAKGRKTAGRARPTRASRSTSKSAEIRAWAKANGHSVPARGRIPAAAVEAYNAAS